jgi:3-oxoadipate enol-lactonase
MNTMTLRASQTLIAYEERGSGPVVVLLHGFPLDSAMWQPQIDGLADTYRVIAPDLPGFGGSAVYEGLTVDALADVVAELLDHLGVNEKVALGGLSMGGYAALAFARLYPQRLRRLVLADTKADPDDAAAKEARAALIRLAEEKGAAGVIEQMLPKLLGTATANRRPDVVRTVRELAARQRQEGILAALKALRDRPDARPGLAHIAVPTLVVVGDQDSITPPEKARELAAGIPNSRLVTIPDSGHLSNMESPEVFTAGVRAFLETASS